MSGKSILFSVLALITLLGVIVAVVFMFQAHFMLGIAGIFLAFIPLKLQQKAREEANGKIDEWVAKYVVPGLALVGILFIVLFFTIWR